MKCWKSEAIAVLAIVLGLLLLDGPIVAASQYHEAPMLAAKVARGELPPVEQRLPESPVVLTAKEVGVYGGTWHRAQVGEIDFVWRLVNYEAFAVFDVPQRKLVPELADSWELNDDYTQMIVHIHPGIKWSDGVPYTANDYVFWWNEVVLGKDAAGNASPWAWMAEPWTMRGGVPMKVEAVDDYTLLFKFGATNPTAPLWFQTGPHFAMEVWPAHYVKTLHPNYNANIESWDVMEKTLKQDGNQNPDQPVLTPWKTVQYVPAQRLVLERNPYFWKVDQEGNQLPYIDKVVIEYLSDIETLKLKLTSGECDFQIRPSLTSADYPLLVAGQERGNYTMKLYHTGRGAQPCLFPNLESSNDQLREFFRNQQVRIALSIGIDRKYINQIVYNGLMKPYSATIGADSWHFAAVPGGPDLLKEWQTTYAEYDPQKANELLDEAGYLRASDGWRHFSDGTVVKFTCAVNILDENKRYLETMQLVKEYWAELGIKLTVDDMSDNEWQSVVDGLDYDMYCYESSDLDSIAWPATLFPTVHWRTWPQVTKWYQTSGKQGKSPEYYISIGDGDLERRLVDLYEKVLSLPGAPDSVERHKLVLQAVRIHIDEGPFMIGIVGEPTIPGIVKNNFKNVGDFCITGPHWMNAPRNMYPEQFYIATEE